MLTERSFVPKLRERLAQPNGRLQLLVGPRQVGKTTAALQVVASWPGASRFAAADEAFPTSIEWLRTQWALARRDAARSPGRALLVLDEIQKISGWSEITKALWDEDRRTGVELAVLLLGSSALLLSHGATESLAGRFDLQRCPHWTFRECIAAFAWSLDEWLFFGGYPGAAALAVNLKQWRSYVRDAIIEPAIARDVLALEKVGKPALLRNLFLLACRYPSQALSYTKMLGQLQDAGNTTTLAHYLDLLEHAWLVTGLEKHASGRARVRGSSPKLVLWSNSLITAVDIHTLEECRADGGVWGRLVENAVGAHLLAGLSATSHQISWWRQGDNEVDFVVAAADRLWAIEVKSGRPRNPTGLAAFMHNHPGASAVIVGSGGIPLEEFFTIDPQDLLTSL